MAQLRRHDMVSVAPEAWRAVLRQRPDLAGIGILADWAARGWPLVVRRPGCHDQGERVPLGLPLPPSMGKLRVATGAPQAAILRAGPPPLLADAAASAPPSWRAGIARLLALCPDMRVFGSLAWQHLTGLPYLADGSDLDLLWRVSDPSDMDTLLHGIADIERDAPMRLDGEIVRADGAGVNWRELAAGDEVLVKWPNGVGLMARAAFLDALP